MFCCLLSDQWTKFSPTKIFNFRGIQIALNPVFRLRDVLCKSWISSCTTAFCLFAVSFDYSFFHICLRSGPSWWSPEGWALPSRSQGRTDSASQHQHWFWSVWDRVMTCHQSPYLYLVFAALGTWMAFSFWSLAGLRLMVPERSGWRPEKKVVGHKRIKLFL